MNPLLPSLRIAFATLFKSRPEIREIVNNLDDDEEALPELMYQLAWAGDYFGKLASLIATAEARLVAHGATPTEVEWREEGTFR